MFMVHIQQYLSNTSNMSYKNTKIYDIFKTQTLILRTLTPYFVLFQNAAHHLRIRNEKRVITGEVITLFYVDCNPRLKYCHNCCYECKDSVELWESGVDQSVSLNIVTL